MRPIPSFKVMAALALTVIISHVLASSAVAKAPIVDESVVFAERNGLLAVEAEHFFKQTKADVRAFHLTHRDLSPNLSPDGDPNHSAGASGGAYVEILPDTRRNHGHKLIHGENFQPAPGKMAVLHYKVHIETPGTYYVWVRCHSTGSEDNGLHVGIDGTWPESGQRLQWCKGKQQWFWESKQRTEKEHCGEAYKIFLEINEPGEHTIHFSMREDGFEFDKWLITTEREFRRPDDAGPACLLKSGTLPKSFPLVKAMPAPSEDTTAKQTTKKRSVLQMPATMFADGKTKNYYVDKDKWLAVNPEHAKEGSSARTFPFPTGRYNVTLMTVGENDGRSSYTLAVDADTIGSYTNPLSSKMYEESSVFHKTWKNVAITEGAIINVTSTVGSEDGAEYSRARWSGVRFTPADEATNALAAPFMKQAGTQQAVASSSPSKGSPTKPVSSAPLHLPREPHGDGTVRIGGQLKQWHKVTFDLAGPYAHEHDNKPNPFTDHRMTVLLKHTDGTQYEVPGYFAADGDAAESGAKDGTTWRAHFAPDRTGQWSYAISFTSGANAALDSTASSKPMEPFDGQAGTVTIAASDKSGRDLRAHGRLRYVGKHYLQFAGSGKYFLKVGADAPETLLAFADFDNTIAGNAKKAPIKTWAPHVKDWREGDPIWQGSKGKGLIGAINYLSGKGCNAFSFLTYNAGGDGDNVWPFIHRDDKLHYDCSKLDQWCKVFDHGTAKGMYLHFKLQETENDDNVGAKGGSKRVPTSLDGGDLMTQRKLYLRELIARFGHNLALNWNLGEENTQSTQQQLAMINYIDQLDAYDHNIVVHTYPGQQDKIYLKLIGDRSKLTGVSLQNSSLETTHAQTVKWVRESSKAGRPWIVAFDESGSASHAQCPDLGYRGFDGHDRSGKMAYTQHKVRKQTLWGTLMAGGAGNEYYFGYQFAENDIVCEDWRSRDQSWDYCRIAIEFFHQNNVPFWEMKNTDELIGNVEHRPTKFCFSKADDIYLVYLPSGGSSTLDLSSASGSFNVSWFNPRSGGALTSGSTKVVTGGAVVDLGNAPEDVEEDWLVIVRK